MLKRMWRMLLGLFRQWKWDNRSEKTSWPTTTLIPETALMVDDEQNAEDEPDIEAGVPDIPTPTIRRLALLTSHLRPYYYKRPEVKRMRVSGFAEAYGFWIRLCGQEGFTSVYSGGYLHCISNLNGQDGTLEFFDRSSCCCDKIAIIRINVSVPEGQTKEILFIVSNKKQIKNENNQVRLHRERSIPA